MFATYWNNIFIYYVKFAQRYGMFMKHLVTFVIVLIANLVIAQEGIEPIPYRHKIILDRTLSIRSGVENVKTLHYGISRLEDRFIPNKWFSEEKLYQKSLGFLGRSAKYILLDLPLDYLSVVFLHEYFGHGSRYREFDISNVDYGYDWPPPYGNGGGHASTELTWNDISIQELSAIWTGGVESHLLLNRTLNMQWINGDEIYYRDASLYFWSFQILMKYINDSEENYTNIINENDPQAYVRLLNNNYGISNANDFIYTMKDLKNHNRLNAINPFIYLSIYSLLKNYLWDGQVSSFSVPMLKVGKINYLPSYKVELTPFGIEHHLENYFRFVKKTARLDIIRGDNTFHSSWGGLGIMLNNLYSTGKLSADLNINIWNQPQLQLDNNIINNAKEIGSAISIRGYYESDNSSLPLSLLAEIGYKSQGYLEGFSLGASPIFMLGIGLKI